MRLKSGIVSLYRTFISRKVTISLIGVLGFFYFLGLIIPQKKLLQNTGYTLWQNNGSFMARLDGVLGLSSIYSSPVVIVFTVLFFVNLFIVTCKRIPQVAKMTRLPESVTITEDSMRSLPVTEHPATLFGGVEGFAGHIRQQGFATVMGTGCVKGIKNRYSACGSLFFHLSFLFILAGGATIFHTYFRGEVRLVEGKSFYGRTSDYHSAARLSSLRSWVPDLTFTLLSIKPEFIDMKPVAIPARLMVADLLATAGNNREGSLDVNRPFVFGSSYILITDGGAAPFFTIVDPGGKTLLADYLPLNILRGDEDRFSIPGTDMEVAVKFWSDFAVDKDGYIVNRSFAFNRPLFDLRIMRNGRQIGAGRLEKPDDVVVFEGYRLSRGDIRYYGSFLVTDERGGGILVSGFLLLVIGLLVRFALPRKEIVALAVEVNGECKLRIGYRVEYYNDLAAAQLDRIIARIAPKNAGDVRDRSEEKN